MRNCSLCDQPILLQSGQRVCSYCGLTEEGDHTCSQGHYLCQACRTALPSELMARVCGNSKESDPCALADLLQSHPVFNQMGPQYHVVTGPVMVTVLANLCKLPDKQRAIADAIERSKDVPALACAQRGVCGAAASAGTAIALLTNAGPLKARERSLAIATTARALQKIADQSGIRCCRQSVYASIAAVLEVLGQELGIHVTAKTPACRYHSRVADCKKEGCPYFPT